MALFPASNSLKTARDDLRLEIQRLEAIVATAREWTEALEKDRTPMGAADEATFDAAMLPIATSLLSNIRAETSKTSTVGLYHRILNVLGIKAKTESYS